MCRESVLNFAHNYRSKNPYEEQNIFKLFILLALDRNYNYIGLDDFSSILNKDELETLKNGGTLSDVPDFKDVPAALLTLTIETYALFKCYDWDNQYEEDTDLIAIYECIQELGYEASDEELAYVNGTHELYVTEQEGGE